MDKYGSLCQQISHVTSADLSSSPTLLKEALNIFIISDNNNKGGNRLIVD